MLDIMHNETSYWLPETCRNAFEGRLTMGRAELLVLASLNILLTPSTVILNICVMHGLRRTSEKYRSATNELVYYLSISDLIVGLLKQPGLTVLLIKYGSHENCLYSICLQAIGEAVAHVSGYLTMCLALDRMVHMKYMGEYKTKMTRGRVKLASAIAIFLSVLWSCLYTLGTLLEVYHYMHMAITCFDACVVSAVLLCYLYMFKGTRKLIREIKTSFNSTKRKMILYQSSVTTTVTLIILTVCTCYSPYIIASFLWFYSSQSSWIATPTINSLVLWSYLFIDLTSTLNSIIYSYRNKRLRNLFRQYVRCGRRRRRVRPMPGAEVEIVRARNENNLIPNLLRRIAWIKHGQGHEINM